MSKSSVFKLAIANRGEVAVRIIRACQELGIRTVLLHSDVDKKTLAYRMSDEKICIGPAALSESYLNIDNMVQGALSAGADAVHPGFGFLSENHLFAQKLEAAGILFVGPRPETMKVLGDKVEAKNLAHELAIPMVPGYQGDNQNLEYLKQKAFEIGYPVMVKVAGGGGGRGLKVIRSQEETGDVILSAQREGQSSFGSSKVFLEKYLDQAKHIEIQVFGDGKGKAVHLFERECSVQRRHQKVVEEAGAADLSDTLRDNIAAAAVALAKRVSYRGAGTVEFLVQDNNYFFLEVNTRLQVEHPVTELMLAVDLVKAQIQLAAGNFILWDKQLMVPRGHSIECRIYAEDSYNKGMPGTGTIIALNFPLGPGRRFDFGFSAGDEIGSDYDSMLGKVIVWDESRSRAIQKMLSVLDETVVFGLNTNIPLCKAIISHPEFVAGTMTTQFMQKYFDEGLKAEQLEPDALDFARAAYNKVSAPKAEVRFGENSPWLEYWRGI